MKKVLSLLAAAALLLVASQSAKAQIYAGGSIGYSTTTLRPGDGSNNRSGSSFKFLPEVGYRINEKMAAGGSLGYMQGYAAFGSFNPNDLKGFMQMAMGIGADISGNDSRVTCFRFAPYFRYVLFNTRRVDLFVEASFALGLINMSQKVGGVWQDPEKFSVIEIAGRPGFSFNIDSHFSIVGHLGSIGFQNLKYDATDDSISRIGTDLDTSNILLGFEYHF